MQRKWEFVPLNLDAFTVYTQASSFHHLLWLYIPGNFTLSNLFGILQKKHVSHSAFAYADSFFFASSQRVIRYVTLNREEWLASTSRRADRLTICAVSLRLLYFLSIKKPQTKKRPARDQHLAA
jgi:hypothetical protein